MAECGQTIFYFLLHDSKIGKLSFIEMIAIDKGCSVREIEWVKIARVNVWELIRVKQSG